MMKKLMETVKSATKQELEMASKDHGETFASDHEAYAVMLEEYDEALEMVEFLKDRVTSYWFQTKNNVNREEKNVVLFQIKEICEKCACEMIQTAAMAEKATRMPLKRDDEKRG